MTPIRITALLNHALCGRASARLTHEARFDNTDKATSTHCFTFRPEEVCENNRRYALSAYCDAAEELCEIPGIDWADVRYDPSRNYEGFAEIVIYATEPRQPAINCATAIA